MEKFLNHIFLVFQLSLTIKLFEGKGEAEAQALQYLVLKLVVEGRSSR